MSWQRELKDEANKVVHYVNDLEQRNRFLRDELAAISSGLYLTEDTRFDEVTRFRYRAGKALAKEGEMPNRKMIRRYF